MRDKECGEEEDLAPLTLTNEDDDEHRGGETRLEKEEESADNFRRSDRADPWRDSRHEALLLRLTHNLEPAFSCFSEFPLVVFSIDVCAWKEYKNTPANRW